MNATYAPPVDFVLFAALCSVIGIAALIFVVAGLREWFLIIKEGTRDEEKQPTPDYADDLRRSDALGSDVVRDRPRRRSTDARVK